MGSPPVPAARLLAAVLLALAAGAVFWLVHPQAGSRLLPGGGPAGPVPFSDPGGQAGPAGRNHPPPGTGSYPARLAVPEPLRVRNQSYRLLDGGIRGQEYVAYDPCRPIRYVIREEGAPPDGNILIHQAARRVAGATGLQFVYEGSTGEPPHPDRPAYQPQRYGDRWAPVLIAWSTPRENPALDGDTIGLGGSTWASHGGTAAYVSGQVELDGPQFRKVLATAGGQAAAAAIIMHELAHLVGLDHVEDPAQLMNAEARAGVTEFGDGDLTGLRMLGQGPCVPEL
ncbi:peptidase [Arthrobacter mobilis]|uniref:Peptidase n=1 Tax=Arthrobacter mobilis TaxID=2724944 RepID=A0A7X6K297_9MICC|nr:peptidase [Arthrobacter mobilis]NKX52942.1 peptidase [Arthrobacter mobilis]